jgi:hypothetical protein
MRAPRLSLLLPAIAFAVMTIGTQADAQNYPWCSNFADGFGGTNCGFTTLEQCRATVNGSGGFCQENDWYKPPVGASVKSAPHHARRHPRNRQS